LGKQLFVDHETIRLLDEEGKTRAEIARITGHSISSVRRVLTPGAYEYHRAYMRTQRQTVEGRIHRLWEKAKARAMERGLDFTVTVEDIAALWCSHCPLLRVQMSMSDGDRDTSPSLDRIDSSRGYTPDNIWVISTRANRIKNNATLEEFETIARNWKRLLEQTGNNGIK
jgi:hypothetical protein